MVAKLKDVAQLTGVSVTTVSRVISNCGSLSQKTIDRVHTAVQELNYQPNALTQAVQGKPSKLVGLIFPNLINPFFVKLVNELEHELFKKGYKTIIASSAQNPEVEYEYLSVLMANQVDGIISGSHSPEIEEYHQLAAPTASLSRYLADNIPIIAADSYHGGKLATRYLVEHDVKHLTAVVGEDTSVSPTINRIQGALDFLNRQKRDLEPLVIQDLGLEAMFPGNYDGVLVSNDVQALTINSLYYQARKQIDEDFFITGHDGSRLVRKVAPYLPAVIQPIPLLAQELVKTLMKRVETPHEEIETKLAPVEFYQPK